MKNYEAESILINLNKMNNLETSVPVSVGMAIIANKDRLETVLKPFHDMRDKLINKYGKDGSISQDNPNFSKCLNEIDTIGNEECDPIDFKKIKLSAIENIKLPFQVISGLACMIEDDTERKGK